ncbi:histidine phosphotransferase family protein [Aestuariibius sp. 2305UL40-4]|uniref:histidine phosphotransferase family protein n=1 Tax=Aestuariibius violaceus TaxID=3234132 RepID=UPI00345E1EC4
MSDTSNRPPSILLGQVGSRICHDLVSPLGAIANGLELLEMSGVAPSQELELIRDSVANANARIRFFRIAFGAAGDGQSVDPRELREILDLIEKGGRLRYRWDAVGEVTRTEARIVFLALLCLETALAFGGEISLARREDGTWRLLAEAPKLRYEAELWSTMAGPLGADVTAPGLVQFSLLPLLLSEAGRRLNIDQAETRILMEF